MDKPKKIKPEYWAILFLVNVTFLLLLYVYIYKNYPEIIDATTGFYLFIKMGIIFLVVSSYTVVIYVIIKVRKRKKRKKRKIK